MATLHEQVREAAERDGAMMRGVVEKAKRDLIAKKHLRRWRMFWQTIYLFSLGGVLLEVYRGEDLRKIVMLLLFIELARAVRGVAKVWGS